MASSEKHIVDKYQKRPGTSGIQGHLYETKLLSLIYYRAIHDYRIEEFRLATNVDKLGSFDDICFRVKVKGIEKPLAVFIQAKHRENNSFISVNSTGDLIRHFNSYMEIRSFFKPNNKDVLFDGIFSETDCLFVIYTTAKSDRPARKYEGTEQSIFGNRTFQIEDHCTSVTFLNELIGTEDVGPVGTDLQPYKLNQLLLEEKIKILARIMAKCILGEFNYIQMLMQEQLVLRYHVILAQQVFNVSNNQLEGYREAGFRNDVFDNDNPFVQLFIEELCTELSKKVSSSCDHVDDEYDWDLTDIEYKYQQIAHLITYENGKFEFLDKIASERYRPFLDIINFSQNTIRRTLEIAVKKFLSSLKFRVPASFGNKDLTIRGGDERKERKLIDLSSKILGLIEKAKPGYIVMIDEEPVRKSLGEGFLQLSGGIASAVGNLLVLDDVSKLLKFNDNYESLGKLAKMLFDQLNCKIENLCEYKFDVRAKIFPKLSFAADEYAINIYSDFFKRLVFYTSQAKEAKVEKMLITEIEKTLCCDDVYTRNIKSNIIFLKYHDAIQKWWMNKLGDYLTEEGSIFKNAERHALNQPLISFINMMHRINNINYTFTDDAINSIKLDDQPYGTVIVTRNIALTIAKLINHLLKKDCVVLDIQYILNLSISDTKILQAELFDLNKEVTLILVCDKAIFGRRSETIATFTESLRGRTAIIILNDQNSVKNAKTYLTITENVLKDERNNLIDMSEESQKSLLENTKVIFRGDEVSLDQILDNESLNLVGELVLYNLMQNDTKVIGKSASHLNYKGKINIERSMKCLKVVTQTLDTNDIKVEEGQINYISTLFDLEEDVVLVIGDPGIGKSTLLTQLSLKTTQQDSTVWILRINLLEFSKQFFEWQANETVIDTLKSLKFLCRVALSEESINKNDVQITLQELNGTVYLKNCTGDEWCIFELNLFLYYYNTKRVIILLDGFDEICPIYAHEVLSLIKAVMNSHQKPKIWITSRSYDKIITELKLQVLYKMEPLNNEEQDLYLSSFWEEKDLLISLLCDDKNNLEDFFTFMSKLFDSKKSYLPDKSINEKPLFAVYLSLLKYMKRKNIQNRRFRGFIEPKSQFSGLFATPLHLNMFAEHLYNQIQKKGGDYDQLPGASKKWDLDVNVCQIYDHFLENKLKIRFQEKNQIDMYRPDNIAQYNREYADTKDKLKKLAAYVVYDKRLLNKHELKHCEELIDKLKEGEEKTDIICNVINDIPIFIHSTFAEYFAVEYICDLLKSQTDRNPQKLKMIYNFILNEMFFKLNKNVLVILDAKIDKQLTTLVEKNKEIIFTLLLEQGYITKNRDGCMKSSLCEAIRLGLKNLVSLLLSTTEDYLNDSNLMDFIEIVKDTNMLMIAVKMEFDELIITIIDQVRMICESKLSALFENIEIFDKNEDFARETTSDLVQKLHANVWTRMNIDPDWENLTGLYDEICFI